MQSKELSYNAKYEDLYAAKVNRLIIWSGALQIAYYCFFQVGPENPFLSEQQKAPKNTLTGFLEPAAVSNFQFEMQRRSFAQLGYALDPSMTENGMKFVGKVDEAEKRKGAWTTFTNISEQTISLNEILAWGTWGRGAGKALWSPVR